VIVPVQGVVQANIFILIARRRCIKKIGMDSCTKRDGFAKNKGRMSTVKNPEQLGE
jgi:hypothetical protein